MTATITKEMLKTRKGRKLIDALLAAGFSLTLASGGRYALTSKAVR